MSGSGTVLTDAGRFSPRNTAVEPTQGYSSALL